MDCRTCSDWEKEVPTTAAQRARKIVNKVLGRQIPEPVDPELKKKLGVRFPVLEGEDLYGEVAGVLLTVLTYARFLYLRDKADHIFLSRCRITDDKETLLIKRVSLSSVSKSSQI